MTGLGLVVDVHHSGVLPTGRCINWSHPSLAHCPCVAAYVRQLLMHDMCNLPFDAYEFD